MARFALYLAGGGARGAYQAGVLKAVHHITAAKTIPFTMISGVIYALKGKELLEAPSKNASSDVIPDKSSNIELDEEKVVNK